MKRLIMLFCLGLSSAFANVAIVPHGQEIKTPSTSANQFYFSFAPVLSYDKYSYSFADDKGVRHQESKSKANSILYVDLAWRHNFKEDFFAGLRFGFYTGGSNFGVLSNDSRPELSFLLGKQLNENSSVYGTVGISRISGNTGQWVPIIYHEGFTLWQPTVGLGYEYKFSNVFAVWGEYAHYFSKSSSIGDSVLLFDVNKRGEMKLSSNKLKAGVRLYF